MKLRYASSYKARAADKAEALLRDALLMAKEADCPRLAKRIRMAIASAEGARRHMKRRMIVSLFKRIPNSKTPSEITFHCTSVKINGIPVRSEHVLEAVGIGLWPKRQEQRKPWYQRGQYA